MEELRRHVESLHNGTPMWYITYFKRYISIRALIHPVILLVCYCYCRHVMLAESAMGLTCQAPSLRICGAGSVLSEYELYFNYARKVNQYHYAQYLVRLYVVV